MSATSLPFPPLYKAPARALPQRIQHPSRLRFAHSGLTGSGSAKVQLAREVAEERQQPLEMAELGRPLGLTEENWTKACAVGTGIQACGVALRRIVETGKISAAARAVAENHAILRCRVAENGKGKLAFERTPEAEPAVEVRPWPRSASKQTAAVALPGDTSDLSAALQHIVVEEMNIPFPNASGKLTGPTPVFEIRVYTDPTKTVIVLRLQSGAVDRPSAIVIMQSFITSLNALLADQKPQLVAAPDRNEVLPSVEDLLPKAKSKGFFQKGIDTVGYVANSVKFHLYPFHSGYSEPKSGLGNFKSDVIVYPLGKAGTADLIAACEREKTTVSAALAAAFLKGGASAEELKGKKQNFSFSVVVDLRPRFDPPLAKNAVGNYSSGLSQDVHVRADADFWELARSVSNDSKKELEKGREFSEMPVLNMLFSQVLKRPSLTVKSSLRLSLLSIFEKTPDARWRDTENLQLAGTFGPLASMHGVGPCICFGDVMVEGPEILMPLTFPTPLFSREQMEEFANTSLAILNAAIK